MRDTLIIGDHILVNKFIFAGPDLLFPARAIVRGDVIVFRSPEHPETKYVKRVVALPGETVELRGKAVFIDGRKLDEPYVVLQDPRTYPNMTELPEPQRSRDHLGPLRVPADSYFVLGDNRDRSYDSRFWGAVPARLIAGRAFVVYWSFDGIQPTSTPDDRARELRLVLRHFFDRTRWNRTLTPIGGYDYARTH